jgi:hypothetical protein
MPSEKGNAMKKIIAVNIIVTLLCTLLVAYGAWRFLFSETKPRPQGAPTAAPHGEGWIDLLDAEHQSQWVNITDSLDIFEIRDGILHLFGKAMGKLRYAGFKGRSFSDFELHLEFKVAPRTNSGVFLRAIENDPVRRGFEVQVLDDYGTVPCRTGTGAIYDMVCPMYNMALPAGEWNSYDIRCEGREVKVTVNGVKVIDTDFSLLTKPYGKFSLAYAELPLEGLIALQDHGGEVWYRNIRVHPLNETEP